MRNFKIITEKSNCLEGEVVPNKAVIPDQEMAYMNFAREEFQTLERLLRLVVMPGLGDLQNPICREIDRHLEQVRIFSGNFCYRHRHLGASVDAVEIRAGSSESALAQGGAA